MKRLITALTLGLTLCAPVSRADDIEIYLNPNAGGVPYVLLMLDLRASTFSTACNKFSECGPPYMSADAYAKLTAFGSFGPDDKVTKFEVFRAVLAGVLENPAFDPIQMALAASNWDQGGTILEGYKPLSTNRADFVNALAAMPGSMTGVDAHEFEPKSTYYEWFRYINGNGVIYGKSTTNNFIGTEVPGYDASIISGANYISPFTDPDACVKLFSLMVAMQGPPSGQDKSLDGLIAADMSVNAKKKVADMMQYMHHSTTDLLSGVNGDQPLEKSWIISDSGSIGATRDIAEAGGSGQPLDLDDPAQLEIDLINIFKEVISVSSTFVAASVPVNVFNQAESLDNLFIALFEARATLNWPGNVKKLKLLDTDADGDFNTDIDASTPYKPGFELTGEDRGRITFDAITYWTDVAELPVSALPTVPVGADGRVVSRGGAGQKINGFIDDGTQVIGATNSVANSRQVFVEPAVVVNGAANTFAPFNADVATVLSTGLTLDLIKWGRGLDVDSLIDPTKARSWILADAIHSRPLALNYGAVGGYTTTNPNIRLFMGTGEGLFHIIENTDTAGVETGKEVFAFYLRELLGNLLLRRLDTEPAAKMRYGVDGPPVAFVVDNDNDGNIEVGDGDEAYVYFGLRRGGNSYYALDVSDPTIAPTLKWKITKTTGGDFDELGMSFSKPIVGKVRFGTTPTDVLIFAGGYNGGWDTLYTSRTGKDAGDADDTVGNAIYIVNARTGALIWKAVLGTGAASDTVYQHAGLVDSIPSAVTPVRRRGGTIHRLYVGDSGGAVWRVDLPEGDATNHRADKWFVSKLAELGTDGAATDRRFFHAPDVVQTFDSAGDLDGVIIASGDRAHPNRLPVTDYFYYIKDRLIVSGAPAVKTRTPFVDTDFPDQTACILGTEGGCSATFTNGWKREMENNGEKGLATPLVDGGRIFLTSFTPSSGASTCAPTEGEARLYLLDLADGTATEDNPLFWDIGSGIAAGAIAVGNLILIPGGGIDLEDLDPPEDTDGDGIPDEGARDNSKLQRSFAGRLFKIYWREPGIDNL